MQILVAERSTKTIWLETNSVEELKTRVEERFGVPKGEQILQFGTKQLQEGASLTEFGIQECMTVHLAMRLRGGRGELEAVDVDCLPVDFLDNSQLPPPTMEREMSHGTAAAHDFCIPEAESSTADKHSAETLDKDNDYYDDGAKPPDFERGDSVLSSLDVGGPSCPSPTQTEQQHAASALANLRPANTSNPHQIPPGVGMKRPLEPPPPMGYMATPMPAGVSMPMAGFPGPLAMAFQAGPFAPQRLPFFPASVPHPSLVHKRPKGLAYDLDLVDDKLKKRLLKNRQSAERSRQKKNAMMKGLEGQLADSKSAEEELRRENALLREQLKAHSVPLPEGVSDQPPPTPQSSRVELEPELAADADAGSSQESLDGRLEVEAEEET